MITVSKGIYSTKYSDDKIETTLKELEKEDFLFKGLFPMKKFKITRIENGFILKEKRFGTWQIEPACIQINRKNDKNIYEVRFGYYTYLFLLFLLLGVVTPVFITSLNLDWDITGHALIFSTTLLPMLYYFFAGIRYSKKFINDIFDMEKI